jgi:hypothetical protein
VSDAQPQDFTRDLIRWSETLAAIARTGMGFTQSLYEKERYEEVLKVAADIKSASDDALEIRREQDHFVQEWMEVHMQFLSMVTHMQIIQRYIPTLA